MTIGDFATDQADFAGDGQCGMGVVAGDHDDADAGIKAFADGVRHFRARRVFQPHQAEQGQAAFRILRGFVFRYGAVGQGEHAQPLPARASCAVAQLFAQCRRRAAKVGRADRIRVQRGSTVSGAPLV